MARRNERDVAFKLTYSYLVNPEMDLSKTLNLIDKEADYGIELFLSLKEQMPSFLTEISKFLKGWTLDRVSNLEKSLLLVAMQEMRNSPDVPFKVAIDEALNLAHTYGGAESGPFINAILDRMK